MLKLVAESLSCPKSSSRIFDPPSALSFRRRHSGITSVRHIRFRFFCCAVRSDHSSTKCPRKLLPRCCGGVGGIHAHGQLNLHVLVMAPCTVADLEFGMIKSRFTSWRLLSRAYSQTSLFPTITRGTSVVWRDVFPSHWLLGSGRRRPLRELGEGEVASLVAGSRFPGLLDLGWGLSLAFPRDEAW